MKKILFIAAVALAAAACSKTFDTNPAASQKAIGFGTWAENLTKAEARVQGSSTFLAGDTFKVSGTKENSGTKTVFDGVTVEAKAGSPLVWEYSPLRFWDSNATSYTFYAVSPAAAATVATDGKVAASDVEFNGKLNDILVATKNVVPNADFNKKVELVFNHAASLVDIKVKKANVLKDATVTVSALTLKNIQSKGNLAVNTYTSNLPDVDWSHDGTSYEDYGPADGVEEVNITNPIVIANDANFKPDYGSTPAASTDLIKKLVVMPQTFATTGTKKQQLEVTYKIQITTDDVIEHTATVDLANFDEVDDKDQNDNTIGGWANGKHYIFYITLDANAIEFTASISDWTTTSVSGYHYIID